MIELERRDKALQYLIDTDEPAAKARAYLLGLEKSEKTIIAVEILDKKGTPGTVPEKDAMARTSHEYKAWKEDYEDAVLDMELYRNRRHTAELIIELWRSEGANRRQGNIT
jgi:hypothetical protein